MMDWEGFCTERYIILNLNTLFFMARDKELLTFKSTRSRLFTKVRGGGEGQLPELYLAFLP